jgi:hypothetical protein
MAGLAWLSSAKIELAHRSFFPASGFSGAFMQQRQLRLGDILDDYCPRERRVTNHAVVAMLGHDVKQTRCTTCDAEHEYKHAKVPRQRRKANTPAALYSQVLAGGPKRVVHDTVPPNGSEDDHDEDLSQVPVIAIAAKTQNDDHDEPPLDLPAPAATEPPMKADETRAPDTDKGPVHRPLIRASLPRPDGQPPQTRTIPEFTIRQPGGRPSRFRPRQQRGGQSFPGNRASGTPGGGSSRGGMRSSGGRPPVPHAGKRHGPGRKRSK